MPGYKVKYLSNPAVLAKMSPASLERLLAIQGDYFGVWLTDHREDLVAADRWGEPALRDLARILVKPDTAISAALAEAICSIDMLSTDEAADELRDRCGIEDREGECRSPADIAVLAWLDHRDDAIKVLLKMTLSKRRAFDHYAFDVPSGVEWSVPDTEERLSLEGRLAHLFGGAGRGHVAKLDILAVEEETWVVVRHGKPYHRDGDSKSETVDPVGYQPVHYDLLAFSGDRSRVRLNVELEKSKLRYLTEIERSFFTGPGVASRPLVFDLAPLRDNPMAIADTGVFGELESVRWAAIKYAKFKRVVIEMSAKDDLLDVYPSPERVPKGKLLEAKFELTFSPTREGEAKRKRTVTVTCENVTKYTRDDDAAFVDRWLAHHRFVA